VRLVELGGVVDEALRGDRDVDAEAVDGDAVRADVLGDAGGEALESRLRHAVDEKAGDRHHRGGRGDGQDRAPPAGDPARVSGLESVARAAHATSAPASASASAIARPTPRLAPVTKAAAPCSSIAVA